METENPLHLAAKKASGSTALAKKIGRSQSTVSDWMRRGWAAPDACADIATAVGHEVTETELLKSAAELKKAARAAKQERAA